jgi:hypothetical protein
MAIDDHNPEGTLKVAVGIGVASSESPSATAPDALNTLANKAMHAGISKPWLILRSSRYGNLVTLIRQS